MSCDVWGILVSFLVIVLGEMDPVQLVRIRHSSLLVLCSTPAHTLSSGFQHHAAIL